ncbi:type II secretion system minor pseudopilin GspI [Motiliproteus sp. SC1-56]|uniref:type II secretion system minor pseudopilin GspI n=1 Tax=Motiliproteus sp. SC1-56 TaxID=2799565 RepID=UPI001A8EE5B7
MIPRAERGVTLLELLVALFIFSLAAGALLKVVGEQGRHAEALEVRYFAELLAHNHLVALHLQPAWPALGERSEILEMAGRSFRVIEQVEKTDTPTVRRVTARVRLAEGSASVLSELQAFMGPTP